MTIPTVTAEDVLVPDRESDEWGVLAAWYSGDRYSEHYRKVTLAHAKEIIRATAAANSEKVSEARIDDLARLHPMYLDYLARHLDGRTKWERAFRDAGGLN